MGLTNFQDVLFGAGGNDETLKANTTTGTLGTVTISGFTLTSEIVDLTQIGTNATLANGGTVNGSHQLTAAGSGGTVILQLDATDATVFKISLRRRHRRRHHARVLLPRYADLERAWRGCGRGSGDRRPAGHALRDVAGN